MPRHRGRAEDTPRTLLAQARRERDISQRALAAMTGISERTLSRLETGEVANPPLRYLVNCAIALGLDDWRELVEPEWETWLPLSEDALKAPRRPARRSG